MDPLIDFCLGMALIPFLLALKGYFDPEFKFGEIEKNIVTAIGLTLIAVVLAFLVAAIID
jgi:hypothetical protein